MAGEINRDGQFAEIVPALARFYLGRKFGLGICAQLLLDVEQRMHGKPRWDTTMRLDPIAGSTLTHPNVRGAALVLRI